MTTAHSATRTAAASVGRALLIVLLLIGALFAVLIAFVWFWSLGLDASTATPAPVASYAEAVTEIDAMVAAEGDDLNPLCHTNLLTHGDQTRPGY